MTVEVKVNLPDFAAQIADLKADFQKKTVRTAARSAGAVFRSSARGFAPVLQPRANGRMPKGRYVGELQRRIYSGITRSQEPGQVRGVVSVRSGRRSQVKSGRDPFYWRFQEGGWIPRGPGQRIRGGNRSKARQRQVLAAQGKRLDGHPFFSKAWGAVKYQALDAFYAGIEVGLARYNAR